MIRFARLALIATVFLTTLQFAAPASAQDVAAPDRAATDRSKALVPLYVSFVALQAADIHSTWRALNAGSVEMNPLLKGVSGNHIGLLAAKAAGTVAVIGVSEHLRTKNRTAAILLMVSSNAAMTWVVEHNYRGVQ